jgi:hypothetical protein
VWQNGWQLSCSVRCFLVTHWKMSWFFCEMQWKMLRQCWLLHDEIVNSHHVLLDVFQWLTGKYPDNFFLECNWKTSRQQTSPENF